MKKKLILSLSLLFVVTKLIYSQVPIDKQKQEEKIALKPLAFDSTKTLEEQFQLENQYQFIGLQLLLPPVINPEMGPIVFSKYSSGFGKENKYYTITGILQGDVAEQLKQKKAINQCGHRYKDFNSFQWKDLIKFVVFILRDDNKNDSLNNAPLYWVVSQSKTPPYSYSYYNSFISVPYFLKQKQLYENQEVISLSDKSKWLCTEVSILKNKINDSKDSTFDVFCILKNETGKQIIVPPPSVVDKSGRSFITEKEFVRLDHANRNQREELYKAEADRQEKHKTECIAKFGQHYGELVAQSKIETGMTTEMCKAAWGAPWDIDKTKSLSKTKKEIWFYNWKYNLHFENGKLIKIEN
jgi:hypothetical protein